MIETDRFIAYISAQAIERQLAELQSTMLTKDIRRTVMRAWASVAGTNAWNYGNDAFGVLAEDEIAYPYWCWYTSLAIELSNVVREAAIHYKVTFPS